MSEELLNRIIKALDNTKFNFELPPGNPRILEDKAHRPYVLLTVPLDVLQAAPMAPGSPFYLIDFTTRTNRAAVSSSADNLANTTVGLFVYALNQIYNGITFDYLRTPNVFKPQNAVAVNPAASVWTPAAGKKFRVMGYSLSGSVAGNYLLKDGAGGTTRFVVQSAAAGPGITVSLGNGYISAAADNILECLGPAASTLSGTIWGTEE